MKKIVITLTLALLFVALANAQDYKTGIGVRLGGWDQGITLKHFIGAKPALEGILAYRYNGFDITGMYEVHGRAFEVDRLNWFIGGGAHIGFYGSNFVGGAVTVIGVTGILGIEYNFTELPINIGIDWKPTFDIVGYQHFWAENGALSVRYIF